ncbi:hypothetical protein S58_43130 [Bradyrhizobium oligotrophicum S58]|uniref:Uncharacterized protein n=1 Tax=Bradyrhizobium oligotrophicum S58 TaxID=1245469 RepID=M4Z991_9BRAD|nr:hypothetical protein [Bradyrhizobium oligotrophicum]BAM90298.1 hypothetical protein S58_43130 [Bradyrhizobium oligotrophicum S58]
MSDHDQFAATSPLAEYKAILRAVIDSRPSGTRQRLAEAIGKNRSFISQIVNPAYATPIPLQHLETIFHICHFSPHEQQAFLIAYRAAHPGRLDGAETQRPMRRLVVELPDFGDVALNAHADRIITGVARGIAALISANENNDDAEPGGKP